MAIATRHLEIYGQPVERHLTADEFLALDAWLPHVELIDGEVVVDSPNVIHQHVIDELTALLREWIKAAHGRGQRGSCVDVKVDSRNVYEPDVWWYCEERKPGFGKFRLALLPDLAVEVLSPSNRQYDLDVKRVRYEQVGLPELWIIDPYAATATLWRRSESGTPSFDVTVKVERDGRLASPQMPGFEVKLAELFP
jgi:Uma2 family endonuclease